MLPLAFAQTGSTAVYNRDLTPQELMEQKIQHYAEMYQVSYNELYRTIGCETAHTFDPTIQSKHFNSEGIQEKSFGLAQIHLPDHPNITLKQATDPDFSLNFMASEFKKGHKYWWKCYTIIFG